MITLSAFRTNLLILFRVMCQHDMYVDVGYRKKVYRITVTDLNQTFKRKQPPRAVDLTKEIKSGKCHICKKLMINGVCMNPSCGGLLARAITPAKIATPSKRAQPQA